MRIKLYNRDGASLYLYRNDLADPIEPHIYEWKLIVDSKHKYIFEYCRFIGEYDKTKDGTIEFNDIQAIDPSGGPMLSLGDEFEGKYKIVKINSINSIWISERNNN